MLLPGKEDSRVLSFYNSPSPFANLEYCCNDYQSE